MQAKNSIKVGFLRKPHGLHGFLKVTPLTEFVEERFAPGDSLLLELNGKVHDTELVVEESRWHGDELLVKFEGFDGVESVQHIRNAYLLLPEDIERLDLEEDDFYADELVGLEVFAHNGSHLGLVKRLYEYPSHPILQVESGHQELLIPFVKALIDKVCLDKGRITLTAKYSTSQFL